MIIYVGTMIVLLIFILCQYLIQRNRNKNLRYICEKLTEITRNSTNENLLVVTDDKQMISLLIQINNLINHNKKIQVDYLKSEMAMRKMLSNISHDLKTPLTVVLGYIEIINMNDSMQPDEKKVLLRKVYSKANEVLELIHKFFDLARLESNDMDIPLSRLNMNEVCKKNILAFYDILTTKGLEVDIDIPENNIYALGNEEALGRILNNLLSNAIKYGSDGKAIGLTLRSDELFVYIDVWDKGKGISERHRDRVFERMYTLEDSRNKLYQGSGLGLTITKRLIEKMGGEIFLDSKPNQKTVFSIKLKKIFL